jgi:hypothetical protein
MMQLGPTRERCPRRISSFTDPKKISTPPVDYPLPGPPHLSPSHSIPPSPLFSLPASYPLSDPEAEHGGGKLHGGNRMLAGTHLVVLLLARKQIEKGLET